MAKQVQTLGQVLPRVLRRRLANHPLVVEEVRVADIKPYPRALRRHSQADIELLMDHLSVTGPTGVITTDEDLVVVNGHAVLEAAGRLGLETFPVIRLSGFSPTELDAIRIALNKLGERATWNVDNLAIVIPEIIASGFPILTIGLSQVEIDISSLPKVDQEVDDDVGDEPIGPPVSGIGDLWICGRHRIVCGDCREQANYTRLLGELSARLTLTDPPYNLKIAGHVSGHGGVQHDDFQMASGEMSRPDFIAFQQTVFQHCADVSLDGALLYAFIDSQHVADQIAAGEAVFGQLKQICVWVKGSAGLGAFYRSRHELVTIWKKGGVAHVNNFGLGGTGRYRTTVWEAPGYASFGADRDQALSWHPTVKPQSLLQDAILDVTHQGDVVLDPFGGSGSTLIAAERTNRIARLIEIEPKYVDVTLRRFMALSDEPPILESTGETFEQVQARRAAEASGDAVNWDILL